jgi:hypothetical protein
MQKIEVASSSHARPQALDEAIVPAQTGFLKGLGAFMRVYRARCDIGYRRQTGIGAMLPNVIK